MAARGSRSAKKRRRGRKRLTTEPIPTSSELSQLSLRSLVGYATFAAIHARDQYQGHLSEYLDDSIALALEYCVSDFYGQLAIEYLEKYPAVEDHNEHHPSVLAVSHAVRAVMCADSHGAVTFLRDEFIYHVVMAAEYAVKAKALSNSSMRLAYTVIVNQHSTKLNDADRGEPVNPLTLLTRGVEIGGIPLVGHVS